MSVLNFFNENLFTSYPFDVNTDINTVDFVDCNIVLGPLQPWDPSVDRVEISSFSGTGSSITVELKAASDGPNGEVDSRFSFTFTTSDDPYTTKWAVSSLGAAYGFGFLTCGELSAYATIAGAVGIQLQEQLAQCLKDSRVTSLRLANELDTQYVDEECSLPEVDVSSNYIVDEHEYTGLVYLQPGRFAQISTIQTGNEITLSIDSNPLVGGSLPCEAARTLPDGYSDNLFAEPECSDMLYTFNGIAASLESHAFLLFGSRGISVTKAYGSDNVTVIPHTLKIHVSPLVLLSPFTPDVSC